MIPTITTLSPRQTFEDNMRSAVLLLRVYRLLDSNDVILTQGEMVNALRAMIQASTDEELLEDTVRRRNDIVHRADRSQSDTGGEPQTITFAWTQQAVDTINHICLALDELVAARIAQIRAMIPA
jgi:hypothetical protein